LRKKETKQTVKNKITEKALLPGHGLYDYPAGRFEWRKRRSEEKKIGKSKEIV